MVSLEKDKKNYFYIRGGSKLNKEVNKDNEC